jgi:fatty-acyl-CoA synthase
VCEEEKIDTTILPTFLLHVAMEAVAAGKIMVPRSLKGVETGGEKVPTDLMISLLHSFDYVHVMYGSTECLAVAMNVTPDMDEMNTEDDEAYSWYRVHPYEEIKVADDSGQPVPRGTIGNLWSRSPTTSLGYLAPGGGLIPIQDSSNWAKIGDVGVMNESGDFRIIGRLSDVISKGGSKIYPAILENFIKGYEKVGNVIVVGVPDKCFNEEVCALVIPQSQATLTEQELKQYCEGLKTSFGMSFVPKYYEIMDTFPKLPSGKVNRAALKDIAKQKFA